MARFSAHTHPKTATPPWPYARRLDVLLWCCGPELHERSVRDKGGLRPKAVACLAFHHWMTASKRKTQLQIIFRQTVESIVCKVFIRKFPIFLAQMEESNNSGEISCRLLPEKKFYTKKEIDQILEYIRKLLKKAGHN